MDQLTSLPEEGGAICACQYPGVPQGPNTGSTRAVTLLAPTPTAPHETGFLGAKNGPGTRSIQEKDDSYRGVLFQIPVREGQLARWRVIVCHEGRQYIIQKCHGSNRWRGTGYYARKQHLEEAILRIFGDDTHAKLQGALDSLKL